MKNLIIFSALLFTFPFCVYAGGNIGAIDPSSKYAWGENIGWVNFGSMDGNVSVTDNALTGKIWNENYGWINLSPSSGGVINNGEGVLSGSAWGSAVGWIYFTGVTINKDGVFTGHAQGSTTGIITFDCSNCSVVTDWRPISERSHSTNSSLSPANGSNTSRSSNDIFVATQVPGILVSENDTAIQNDIALSGTGGSGDSSLSPQTLFDIALSSEGLRNIVMPGDSIAFSVKLLNFGSNKRADVTVSYRILDSSLKEIYAEQETVAVDTTASFVKRLPVSKNILPGKYIVESSLSYSGQIAPAISRFTFTVSSEPKTSNVLLPVVISIFAVVCAIFLFTFIMMRRRQSRFIIHNYDDKPKEERIYYEIISDTIGQMRQRTGDVALDVALNTDGLVVDEKTGKVLRLTESPAKVIASLVAGYEKVLGKKVSFSLRKGEKL